MLRHILRVAALAAAPTLALGQTMADDFARETDFSQAPPRLGYFLERILDFAEPNGTYDHSGGPPFTSPRPPLPSNVDSIYARCRSDYWVSSSTPPRCLASSKECFVTIVFADGSRYSFEDLKISEFCADGSRSSFHKRYHVVELGPPGDRDGIVQVESWTKDDLETRRRHVRARAGATASFTNRAGVPVVSGGPLTIDIAPGGGLDLRQNPAANGPLFETDGPATIRCDTVLLDPGVTLADLFTPPPIVLPGVSLPEEHLVLPTSVSTRSTDPFAVRATVLNTGNVDQQLRLSWLGPATMPGETTVAVRAGSLQHVDIPLQLPPGLPVRAATRIQVQAESLSAPGRRHDAMVRIENEHPGVAQFGSGTPGCLGAHQVDIDGPPTADGSVVELSCAQNAPGAIGVAMFGTSVGGSYGTLLGPGGFELYVDPFSWLFITAPLVADPSGVARFGLRVPARPRLRGVRLDFQPLMLWPASCTSQPITVSTGPALALEIQ